MLAAKFRFYGLSSHAADAPEQGRSALDGVEAMNHMVIFLREHVPSDSRIHYVITSGVFTIHHLSRNLLKKSTPLLTILMYNLDLRKKYNLSNTGSGVFPQMSGIVSWIAPSGWLCAATFVSGTYLHSWQAVAAGGMGIGTKGMLLAAKTMALTAYDFYTKPSLVKQANEEFERCRGKDFEYIPLLGDRKPPLNYKIR